MSELAPIESGGEFLLYQAEDGQVISPRKSRIQNRGV
jgi:hypothetical protein